METPKRSAHKIWLEAKEKNLTKEETKKLLVNEGVIVKKSDQMKIEKLEAEKKEILEALGISLRLNKAFGANSEWIEVQEIESLIQKHKQ